MVVDAHCHVGLEWFEPVEILLAHMDRAGVDVGVLTLPVFAADDGYQRACVARFPDRFVNVAAIPPEVGDPLARLETLLDQGISGLRIRSTDRYEGGELRLWRAAERAGVTVSCFASTGDLASAEFRGLLEAVPDLPVVIEHLGSMRHAGEDAPGDRRAAFELAARPNTYMKIHGLAEFAPRLTDPFQDWPFAMPLPPFLDRALERFGPDRLLWGSDFPNACAREGYANALGYTRRYLAGLTGEESANVFGGTARRLFPPVGSARR